MTHALPDPNESLLHNGSVCAGLANLSYHGENAVESLLNTWDDVCHFENANASGLVGWHNSAKVAFISIAGTNQLIDAINDMSCDRVPVTVEGTDSTIEVHQGFRDYAQAAINGIRLLQIKSHLRRKSLFIVGHSLGGAAAEIIPLLQSDLIPHQVHTFGSPRWCASENAMDYPFMTTHWRRPEDIVPDVPLHLGWLRCLSRVSGFSHVRGQTCWITKSYIDPETSHALRRFQRIVRYTGASIRGLASAWRHGWMPFHTTGRIIATLNQQAAKDHLIGEYCRLLYTHRANENGGE